MIIWETHVLGNADYSIRGIIYTQVILF